MLSKSARSLFLVLTVLTHSAKASEQAYLEPLATITLPGVKGRFDHFSIDAKGQRLFVAALGNNTVEIVELAPAKRIQSIGGMSKPTGVLFVPEDNKILGANGDNGTVKILDGGTYQMANTLKDLPDADNLRFDPKTKLAWLGYGDGALAVIDPAGAKVVASIKLSGHPESFQLEKNGVRIFVNVPETKQVVVIDREQRTIIGKWPMKQFQANFPMAFDETNRRLFVGCRKPARLVVLDADTGKAVADLEISGDTDDLFYDAKRKRLYISCGEGYIDVVEQASVDSYQRIAKIPTSLGARTSFFSPDLDRYCVAVPERGGQKAELRIFQAK